MGLSRRFEHLVGVGGPGAGDGGFLEAYSEGSISNPWFGQCGSHGDGVEGFISGEGWATAANAASAACSGEGWATAAIDATAYGGEGWAAAAIDATAFEASGL